MVVAAGFYNSSGRTNGIVIRVSLVTSRLKRKLAIETAVSDAFPKTQISHDVEAQDASAGSFRLDYRDRNDFC